MANGTNAPRQRRISVTRRVGDYTYGMDETITYYTDSQENREAAILTFRHAMATLRQTLNSTVAHILSEDDKATADSYKQPSQPTSNVPHGVTFDPESAVYPVLSLIINIDRGKRYVKCTTNKVQDYGFTIWPDFPEKNQWELIHDHTGIDVAHVEANEYKLSPKQQFGIRLGKDKANKSRIMQFVWKLQQPAEAPKS